MRVAGTAELACCRDVLSQYCWVLTASKVSRALRVRNRHLGRSVASASQVHVEPSQLQGLLQAVIISQEWLAYRTSPI